MHIWVTGSKGMLGSRVIEAARMKGHEVVATDHWTCPIDDLGCVVRTAKGEKPDAIINCAGKLPGAPATEMILANALAPHLLAWTGIPMVHMSTDCVFSGQDSSPRCANDRPDPTDLYGRTKLAGEVEASHVLNVRGSFVGPEGGFLKWLLAAKGDVEAWEYARWNGTTADIMAVNLVELAEGSRTGVVHLASSKPVTKAWMVQMFVDVLGLPVKVKVKQLPFIDRYLYPDIVLPDTEQTLRAYAKEMKKCPTPA